MRALIAFVAAIVGVGLPLRGVAATALGFFAAAAALIAWRIAPAPLRKIEVALAAALSVAGAVRGHAIEGVCAAVIVVSLIELARIIR